MAKSKAQQAAEKAATEEAAGDALTTTTAPPVVTDDVEAGLSNAERPKAEGVLDVVKAFNLKEVNAILALFEPPFEVKEIWTAGRAVIDLGEKLEGYIAHNRLPAFAAHQSAATVTDQEIAAQVREHLKAATTTQDGARPRVGADGKVEMDPVLAGLLINLATRALSIFLERLTKPK